DLGRRRRGRVAGTGTSSNEQHERRDRRERRRDEGEPRAPGHHERRESIRVRCRGPSSCPSTPRATSRVRPGRPGFRMIAAMTTSESAGRAERTALVLAGGAARGAYEVGVVEHVLKNVA